MLDVEIVRCGSEVLAPFPANPPRDRPRGHKPGGSEDEAASCGTAARGGSMRSGNQRTSVNIRAIPLLATLSLLALASIAHAASRSPRVGSPVPTRPPRGQPPLVKSSPPDRNDYNRPAIPGDIRNVAGAVPAGYTLADVVVSNSDPNLALTDTISDGEPSLAVNSSNTNQLAMGAFSSNWGSGNAAIWYSSNGGATWTKAFTVPRPTNVSLGSGPGCPCDQTLDYDRTSNLFGTFLIEPSDSSGDVYTGDTSDPTSAAAWQWDTVGGVAQQTDTLAAGANNADQPWLRINRDPTTATQDNAYVAYDDLTSPATIQVAVAPGSRPPNFTRNKSPGIPGCCVNPGTRLAAASNGTMYVIWQYATGTNADGSQAILYTLWGRQRG